MQQYFLALTAGIIEGHLIKRTPGSKAKSKAILTQVCLWLAVACKTELAAGAVVSSKKRWSSSLESRRTGSGSMKEHHWHQASHDDCGTLKDNPGPFFFCLLYHKHTHTHTTAPTLRHK